jgi:hypothetical protein
MQHNLDLKNSPVITPMLFVRVVLIGQKQKLKRIYTSINPRIFIRTLNPLITPSTY